MRPFTEATRPLFAFLLLFVITRIWCLYSRNNIINLEPRIMFVLLGTQLSNIACRLIVAQMSGTRCGSFNVLLWSMACTVAVSCLAVVRAVPRLGFELDADYERWIVQRLTIFVTFVHLHCGKGMVSISAHNAD